MPSYEPTPRRFSVLSVPQSAAASRRNSFDDATQPSLVHNNHGGTGATVNLELILSRLQFFDAKDEERGRSRNGIDTGFEAPVARRRESSASTREKIALWEERSRSQERGQDGQRELDRRGRSKSRLRDLTAGNRVSVVPEVPELAATFKNFAKEKKREEEPDGRIFDLSHAATPPKGTKQSAIDVKLSKEQASDGTTANQSFPPQTPSRAAQAPFTPDATPKERPESLGGPRKRRESPSTNAMIDRSRPASPKSNSWAALAPSPPATPVAAPTLTPPRIETDMKPLLVFEGSEQQNAEMGLGKGNTDQAWRISTYRPDFPVSTHYPHLEDIQSLAHTRFDGDPLQKPSRSQVPDTAPASLRPRSTGEDYPYPTRNVLKSGDWVVSIPGPAKTYIPTDQNPGQTQRRSVSRAGTKHRGSKHHEWDAPPVIERALHAASVSVIKGLELPIELYRGFRDVYYPAPDRPDIIKAYTIRRRLPVRIFFPVRHDLTSPALLPTLFTIHGGGFTVGSPSEDDVWNRGFADSFTILVIALNYSKAPWAPFPGPLLDVEALYHAILNDESLPIDRIRTAIAGFDSGANLALGLSQLPSVKTGRDPNVHRYPHPHFSQPPRSNPPPAAVISVCGILDFTVPVSQKLKTRPYKNELRGPRGWGQGLDWVGRLLPSCAWSYIPYGHDAADPLLSPAYADRRELPPHVFVMAAELDCLGHESWKAASVWGGRPVPVQDDAVGRVERSLWRGCLEEADNTRFSWVEEMRREDGVRGSTRWLLVPDVVHGFDSANWRNKYLWGDEEARMDAEMKTMAYQREMAEWLWGVVWR
ncbi:Alpha/Beta hydrolase protein [Triangularia setosa]|uniref:Alpha/Beta hydrolase protein n=1 Tax=Triangularia setosa TaxID=2587417 RepID=A0AAN7A8R6_9PEZI|nr:Alpha/Beta hydrolase protein [Podospora setosa]